MHSHYFDADNVHYVSSLSREAPPCISGRSPNLPSIMTTSTAPGTAGPARDVVVHAIPDAEPRRSGELPARRDQWPGARSSEPLSASQLLGALVAVLVVVASFLAFLLAAVAVGVATACVWTWRTLSPAPTAPPGMITARTPDRRDGLHGHSPS
ncbi:hypothetical protein V5D56_13925 [Cellulosimicrobium sp. PMB13]|uniref:hypothetical protein n=1 Tax=Cellulosimicrobium sp. PMB13 TaxID=3120158 RepID=UPI003F4B0E54